MSNIKDGTLPQEVAGVPPLSLASPPRFEMKVMSCAELDAGQYNADYYIGGILAVGQPGIIAAAPKSLKTSIAAEMLISVATSTKFLGHYSVARQARCMFVTGESGLSATQDLLRRICKSKGISLRDVTDLNVCADLPRLDNPDHLAELAKRMATDKIELVVIDPAYLAMPGCDAGNLFIQGEMLRNVSDICLQLGATSILVHHIPKGKSNNYAVPELGDMAWAGFSEHARQWWMLGRREKYQPGTGDHRLWLNAGGSLGHSTLVAVDIAEGLPTDPGGRRWEVTVSSAEEKQEQAAMRKSESKSRLEEDGERKILDAMRQYPNGETKKTLGAVAKLNSARAAQAIESLVRQERIRPVGVIKNGKRHDGYAQSL